MSETTTNPAGFSYWLQPQERWKLITLILVILHAVGIAGVLIPIHEDFLLLTPFNLLPSLSLILWNHPQWSRHTVVFIIISFILGYGSEVFGVQTGLLFGDYVYGPVLGWKWMETPFMIGVNWIMVGYVCGISINYLFPSAHFLIRAVLGALSMVAFDVLIEPVAMAYDFWQWEGGVIPLQNYIGWFGVSLPLQVYFAAYQGGIKNKAAISLFIVQIIFFATLLVASL